jgi:hypothetical protein
MAFHVSFSFQNNKDFGPIRRGQIRWRRLVQFRLSKPLAAARQPAAADHLAHNIIRLRGRYVRPSEAAVGTRANCASAKFGIISQPSHSFSPQRHSSACQRASPCALDYRLSRSFRHQNLRCNFAEKGATWCSFPANVPQASDTSIN